MADVTVIDIGATIAAHRRWFMFLGIALAVAGVLAIGFPLAGSLAVAIWAAIAFFIAGVGQVAHAFAARRWQGFTLGLLVGLLYLATAFILWINPMGGVVTLTVLLAAALVIDGVLRSILAFQIRPHAGWGLLLFGGLLGIVTGIMIFNQLPTSAVWALGLLLGVNLIFSGVSFAMLASAARPADPGSVRV